MRTGSQPTVEVEGNGVGLIYSLSKSLPPYPPELKLSNTLTVRIVTPRGILWQGPAQSVILPSPEGELGILRSHIALTTSLDVGVLRIRTNGQYLLISLLGGWAQIERDEVIVVVKGAERGEDINPQIAQSALEAATVVLEEAKNQWEKQKAKEAFKQAQARWKAAQGNEFADKQSNSVYGDSFSSSARDLNPNSQ